MPAVRVRTLGAGLVIAIGASAAVFQVVVWFLSGFDTPPSWPWEVLLYAVAPAVVAAGMLFTGVRWLQRLRPDGWLAVAMTGVATGVVTTLAALLTAGG